METLPPLVGRLFHAGSGLFGGNRTLNCHFLLSPRKWELKMGRELCASSGLEGKHLLREKIVLIS